MSEQNKTLARRYAEEFWNGGRTDLFEEIVAQDAVSHSTLGDSDAEGWKQGAAMMRNAFPDLHIKIDDELADADRVVQRWTISGTNKGEIFGRPATGEKAVWQAITIFRLSRGRIAEIWSQGDTFGMMQQLGAIPSPGR